MQDNSRATMCASASSPKTSQFQIGEYFHSASEHGTVYRVISVQQLSSQLWYRCNVLSRPLVDLSYKQDRAKRSAYREVLKLANELGVTPSQIVIWTSQEVDIEHVAHEMMPALVFSRMNCVQFRYLAGEQGIFLLAGAMLPARSNSIPRIALLNPGPVTAQPPYYETESIDSPIRIPCSQLTVPSRTNDMIRGRSAILTATETKVFEAIDAQEITANRQFVVDFNLPLDVNAWEQAFAIPLQHNGLNLQLADVMESSSYRDGGAIKKQVITSRAQGFVAVDGLQVSLIKQVLGKNFATFVLSNTMIVTLNRFQDAGISLWYKAAPITQLHVRMELELLPFDSLNPTSKQQKSSGASAAQLASVMLLDQSQRNAHSNALGTNRLDRSQRNVRSSALESRPASRSESNTESPGVGEIVMSEVKSITSNLSSLLFGGGETNTKKKDGENQKLSRFQVVTTGTSTHSNPVQQRPKSVYASSQSSTISNLSPSPVYASASRRTAATSSASVANLPHSTTPTQSPTNAGKWSKDERSVFLIGLRKFGAGEWVKISELMKTRTPHEVREFGVKYLRRLESTNNGPSNRY